LHSVEKGFEKNVYFDTTGQRGLPKKRANASSAIFHPSQPGTFAAFLQKFRSPVQFPLFICLSTSGVVLGVCETYFTFPWIINAFPERARLVAIYSIETSPPENKKEDLRHI